MKIKIDNASKDITIFEGEFSYDEDITENPEKPSILLNLNGENENYELYFFFNSKEELDKYIQELQYIRNNLNNLK